MGNPVIIPIAVKGGKTFSYMTENENYYKAVKTVAEKTAKAEKRSVNINDYRNAAQRKGDLGILEYEDLTPRELIEYAKISGKYKDYDIKLSKDGKYYEITIVKEQGLFKSPVRAYNVKSDFGLRNGVLIDNNPELQQSMGRDGSGKQYTNLDNGILQKGTTLRIPINEVIFTN